MSASLQWWPNRQDGGIKAYGLQAALCRRGRGSFEGNDGTTAGDDLLGLEDIPWLEGVRDAGKDPEVCQELIDAIVKHGAIKVAIVR